MRYPLKLPPGMVSDDTARAAEGRWADGSNMRFWQDLPETIGGWESLTSNLLGGVCRTVFGWTDNANALNIAFGTHATLEVWMGGDLFDITPTLARPAATLGANPLSTTNGSPTVVVTWPGHGLETGASITVSGAAAVGGITPNRANTAITKLTDDTFSYAFTSNATGTATGGGSAVVITPLEAFAAGAIDGTGGAGYGTGTYSTGTYSSPSTEAFFPRTWRLAAWGQNLLANPRGGTIFGWENNTATPAAPLADAPRQVTAMLVAPQDQVFALGCNEEASGVFNPLCIRHSGVRDNTQWNTATDTTAREYILPGGGAIVSGRVIGSYLLVWTTQSLFLGSYVGDVGQVWRFDRVGEKCGLIGPNAAVVVGQTAYWLGVDLQFYAYSVGGAVTPVPCPIRKDMVDNIASSQADKIVASSISAFSEIRFDYPDSRDGYENSRYVALSVTGQGWYRGQMARTCFLDAGPAPSPVGVTYDGAIYWHERGNSADGAALSWFIETADQLLSDEFTMMVRSLWPDFKDQVGPASVTLTSRIKPQAAQKVTGPVSMVAGAAKADLRAVGRYFRVKFSGSSAPAKIRIGTPIFDIAQAGKR